MPRREFVRRLPVVATGIAVGTSTASLAACAGTPYFAPVVAPGALTIPSSALADTGDAFVQAPGMERPIYVRRSESGEAVAVLAACTHRGCQPEPVADRLVCPCHGSEFSFEGAVLGGPAEEALIRYRVDDDGEVLVIRTAGGGDA